MKGSQIYLTARQLKDLELILQFYEESADGVVDGKVPSLKHQRLIKASTDRSLESIKEKISLKLYGTKHNSMYLQLEFDLFTRE